LTEVFREDYPAQLQLAREALADGDQEELRGVGHSLKGSLANLAAGEACGMAAIIEELANRNELMGAGPKLDQLALELDRVYEALMALCQKHAAS
jgi:HPt (histidine-containing phosphotransfer) domain-containing protein